MVQDGEDFGEDADGDFVGVVGSQIETEGGAEGGELGEAGGAEFCEDLADFFLAADHAEIGHAGVAESGGEGIAVELIVAAEKDEGFAGLPGFGGEVFSGGGGKALVGGEGEEFFRAVIEDGDVPVAGAGEGGEGAGAVAGTDEDEGGGRQLGFDEDGDFAATDGAEGVGRGFVQGVSFEQREAVKGQSEGFGEDEGFEFSAADGAGSGAVRVEEHFAAGLAGHGAAGGGEGDEKMGTPLLPGEEHFVKEGAGHGKGDS